MGWPKRLCGGITSYRLSNMGRALRNWAQKHNAKAADKKSKKSTEHLPDGRIRTVIADPDGAQFAVVFPAEEPKPSKSPDAPKRKRRRRTPEERESDRPKTLAWLIKESQRRSREAQNRQVEVGITHYIWQTMEDERTCGACAANNGKKFSWQHPPATGHPGLHLCEGEGHCRCLALPHFDL